MHDLPPSGARGVLLTPTIRLRIGPVVQYQRTSALPLKAKHVSATQPRTTRGRALHRRGAGLRRPPVQIFPFLYFSSLSWMDTGRWLYTECARPGVQWSPSLYSPLCGALLWRRNIWIAAGMKHAGPSSGSACKHTGRSSDLTALNRLWLASAQKIETRSWRWIQAQTWTGRETRAWRKRGVRQARMSGSCTRSGAKREWELSNAYRIDASASAGEHSTADALGSLAQTLDVHRVLHVDTHLHNEKLGCYLSDIGLQRPAYVF
ncbi:hypothetical protein DFH08DRAFT_805591 [Mycena albidolilacea]|uniref:Uncharacterized protein n=1 Tax=Mycena albidolilacea TaxID=1033008 RepID=A0AAD7EUA4_9AGAR|nr:hypothetical protein DFH08DRAFT_805591 [Mycena albidolilacea]